MTITSGRAFAFEKNLSNRGRLLFKLDKSRSTLVELRRRLDDSQAALQELGRENQSIQGEKKM